MAEAVETREQSLYRNFNKLSMFTPTPGVEGRRAQFTWSMRDGNPRIVVWTNHPEDNGGKGQIYAGFNAETFGMFIALFRKVIASPTPTKVKFDNYIAKYENDRATGDRTLGSELWFGKDESGFIWISLTAPERPKVVFKFGLSDWHNIFIDGVQMSEAQASVLQAEVNLKTIEDVYNSVFAMEFDKMTQRQIDAKARREARGNGNQFAKPEAKANNSFNAFDEFQDIKY